MLQAVVGRDSVYTAHVLVLLARAHASRADWPQVLDHAARALATKLSYEDSGELILAHYWHGVALAESRRDVRGGIAEAKAARVEMMLPDSNTGPDTLAVVDAWLAKHGVTFPLPK